MRFLEETLTHCRHGFLVFADLLWYSNKHTQFWRQVDVLAFLFYFKERLVETHNLLVVLLTEVLNHGYCLASFTLLKAGCLWAHVPSNAADLVSFVMAVAGHNDGVFKLIIDSLLDFYSFGRFARELDALLSESHHLLVN